MTGGCIKWLETTKRQQSGNRNREGQRVTSKRQALPPKATWDIRKKAYEQDNTEFCGSRSGHHLLFLLCHSFFISEQFQAVSAWWAMCCAEYSWEYLEWWGYLFPHTDIFWAPVSHLSNQGKHPCCHEAGSRGRAVITVCRLLQLAFSTVPAGAEVDGIL